MQHKFLCVNLIGRSCRRQRSKPKPNSTCHTPYRLKSLDSKSRAVEAGIAGGHDLEWNHATVSCSIHILKSGHKRCATWRPLHSQGYDRRDSSASHAHRPCPVGEGSHEIRPGKICQRRGPSGETPPGIHTLRIWQQIMHRHQLCNDGDEDRGGYGAQALPNPALTPLQAPPLHGLLHQA